MITQKIRDGLVGGVQSVTQEPRERRKEVERENAALPAAEADAGDMEALNKNILLVRLDGIAFLCTCRRKLTSMLV